MQRHTLVCRLIIQLKTRESSRVRMGWLDFPRLPYRRTGSGAVPLLSLTDR